VEVDRDTGVVSIEKFVVVHDCGRVINPLLADAQIAGGVMQGLGGALCEEMVHDPDGQVLSGSFMDYAMPRAEQAPPLVLDHIENPSTRNPLGVKGLGERRRHRTPCGDCERCRRRAQAAGRHRAPRASVTCTRARADRSRDSLARAAPANFSRPRDEAPGGSITGGGAGGCDEPASHATAYRSRSAIVVLQWLWK